MAKQHNYTIDLVWTGNVGVGTENYTSYERSHTLRADHKPDLLGSSDPMFRGDKSKWNPEELLLASLSSCHMLWYLHFCSDNKIIVLSYEDAPSALMVIDSKGSGKFSSAELRPSVFITSPEKMDLAASLHIQAHEYCFIANSMNFPVTITPTIQVRDSEEKK